MANEIVCFFSFFFFQHTLILIDDTSSFLFSLTFQCGMLANLFFFPPFRMEIFHQISFSLGQKSNHTSQNRTIDNCFHFCRMCWHIRSRFKQKFKVIRFCLNQHSKWTKQKKTEEKLCQSFFFFFSSYFREILNCWLLFPTLQHNGVTWLLSFIQQSTRPTIVHFKKVRRHDAKEATEKKKNQNSHCSRRMTKWTTNEK